MKWWLGTVALTTAISYDGWVLLLFETAVTAFTFSKKIITISYEHGWRKIYTKVVDLEEIYSQYSSSGPNIRRNVQI